MIDEDELKKKSFRELGDMLAEGYKADEYKLILKEYTERRKRAMGLI